MPWDPMRDFALMKRNTDDFMALWRSYKTDHRGACTVTPAAGGSDGLCCDFIVMAADAQIGYMPARVWAADHRDVGVSSSAPSARSRCC